MKKIVGIIAAAALATSAFAEVNIGSWNRAVFEPINYDGDKLNSFTGASWGVGSNGGCRSGLSFSAATENAGIAIDINAEDPATGDNALVWVKPVDMLTVKIGKINDTLGRLDHSFGTWDLARFNGACMQGEGFIVDRNRGNRGFEVTLEPVEGLVIDYNANFAKEFANPYDGDDKYKNDKSNTYTVMWENSSTVIGYKADFGFIRAVINGQPAAKYSTKDSDTKPAALIGLAADITAIENLALKVGVSIPTVLKSNQSKIDFGAGVDYTLDALTLHAQTILSIRAKKYNSDLDCDLGAFTAYVGAGVDFAFNDAWKLISDVRFNTFNGKQKTEGADLKYEDPAFGAYLGLRQQLSNASFDFGAQFGKRSMTTATGKADEFTFAVPLTITASF